MNSTKIMLIKNRLILQLLRIALMLFGLAVLFVRCGQLISDFCKYRGMDTEMSSAIVAIILIGISAFLTSLNLFNRIGKFAGRWYFGSYYWVCKFYCFSCYRV